jgi:hypothetical protein
MDKFPRATIPGWTHRLIPSRFPPIQVFATVASADDLAVVMELEGWTNDRLVEQRLSRLPRSEWVFGTPNVSVVMASFLHAAPAGLRFTAGDLGAWYAAFAVNTAIAEVSHHLRREMLNARMDEMHGQYRTYEARLAGDYVDIKGAGKTHPELYDPASYGQSQIFGERVRASPDSGIVYDSVRHAGGVNVVCYRPRDVRDVRQTVHWEIVLRQTGKIIVRRL